MDVDCTRDQCPFTVALQQRSILSVVCHEYTISHNARSTGKQLSQKRVHALEKHCSYCWLACVFCKLCRFSVYNRSVWILQSGQSRRPAQTQRRHVRRRRIRSRQAAETVYRQLEVFDALPEYVLKFRYNFHCRSPEDAAVESSIG